MSQTEDLHVTILGPAAFMFGAFGKLLFHMHLHVLLIFGFLIGLIMSYIAIRFGVDKVYTLYNQGQMDQTTRHIPKIQTKRVVHKDWWSFYLEAQVLYFPLATILGGMIGVLLGGLV